MSITPVLSEQSTEERLRRLYELALMVSGDPVEVFDHSIPPCRFLRVTTSFNCLTSIVQIQSESWTPLQYTHETIQLC